MENALAAGVSRGVTMGDPGFFAFTRGGAGIGQETFGSSLHLHPTAALTIEASAADTVRGFSASSSPISKRSNKPLCVLQHSAVYSP